MNLIIVVILVLIVIYYVSILYIIIETDYYKFRKIDYKILLPFYLWIKN
jgi:hypothetical protein